MLATSNSSAKVFLISLLSIQVAVCPLAALAAPPVTGSVISGAKGADLIDSRSPVDHSASSGSEFVDDFGSIPTVEERSKISNASVSLLNSASVVSEKETTNDKTDTDVPDYSEQSLLRNDTPILASAVSGELLAQSDSSNETPILREGISLSDDLVEKKIDSLTKQILLKEIELERFGIHYNQEVAKQGRWKGWRYGFFQELNSGLGLAGGIISVYNRGRHLKTPTNVKRELQESANYIPMIGTIIGAGAAGLEMGINEYHMFQAGRKGYSAKKSRKRVLALRNDIDSMLSERSKLVGRAGRIPLLAGRVELDQAEQQVLQDMRDQNLQQFERFHISKRRLFAFQQMQLGFDVFKNVTNALGYEFAYLSLHRRQRVYNGYAGVMFAVSGGLTMFGPILSRVYGKVVSEHHRHLLKPATQCAETATLERLKMDCALLDKAVQNSKLAPEKVAIVVERFGGYAGGEKAFEDAMASSEKARDRSKLTATQNIGAGAYVGASKVAAGVLFIYPGFNHRYNKNSGVTAARGTNNNLFAAGVIGLPATAFSIFDTLRINVRGEIDRHNQLKAGKHPSQLSAARLKQLDELENKIKLTAE